MRKSSWNRREFNKSNIRTSFYSQKILNLHQTFTLTKMKGLVSKSAYTLAIAVAISLISCTFHAAEKVEEKIIESAIDKGVEKLE